MSKNIFYPADEWKKMANALDKNIKNFEKALAHAKNDLDIIQDENSSCWSGENAYKSVQGCLANFDHDAELLKNLNKCSDYVQNVINS